MDPISSFSGLISGIDFRSLVDEIALAEARPILQMEDRISQLEARSDAYVSFEGLLSTLKDAAEALRDGDVFAARSTVSRGDSLPLPLSAVGSPGATTGSHQIEVLSLAAAERIGGSSFSKADEALGLSGEFLINGVRISVSSSDTLEGIVDSINRLNTGSASTRVSASALSLSDSEHRLILGADQTGSTGIDLVDGSAGILRSLGLLDATTSVKRQTSDGAQSDSFANSIDTIGTLRGLTSPPAAAAVTVGALAVTLDLATMSLADVAAAINAEATTQSSAINASVIEETVDGVTSMRLDVNGTTFFSDSNRILELLGVLEGGRGSETQVVKSTNGLQQADGLTPATTATLLTDLSVGGSAAGVATSDTLTIAGRRGDGTTFTITHTVTAGETVQDLLDTLNDATSGFGAGTRTATATIDGSGQITVTDATTGGSQLSLSIIANNEGGGSLDLGAFGVDQAGLDREIASGSDAEITVDGVRVTRTFNDIDDVLDGLTLNLLRTSDGNVTTVEVSRDKSAALAAVKAFVDAQNAVSTFVRDQSISDVTQARPPLAGDASLRSMSLRLKKALQTSLTSVVAGDMNRLTDVGIEIQRDGTFLLKEAILDAALDSDPSAVERLFSNYGVGSSSTIEFAGSGDDTVSGSYAVEITQVATTAFASTSGFVGTYVDDGTPDTLTLRDVGSDSTYSVELSNGDSLQTIVDGLNVEFAKALTEVHTAATGLFSDPVATAAAEATVLANLHDSGGTALGVADGDTFTISGTQSDGSAFISTFDVTDVATQTLGDVISAIELELGNNVDVEVDPAGLITATARDTGASLMTLSLTSDNLGGGAFALGGIAQTQEGRGKAQMVAKVNGGELELEYLDYGSSVGFEVSFTSGGTDGTSSLGLAAGTSTGLDVAGTIGGLAATGQSQLLVAAEGGNTDGLSLRYLGTGTGTVGTLTFRRGIASLAQVEIVDISDSDSGLIRSILDSNGRQIERIGERIVGFEERIERRRQSLLKRFLALEQVMAKTQAQGQFLSNQLAVFTASQNNNG